MSFLEYLKTNSGCLYIYNRSSIIYGLNAKEFTEYIIVISENFKIPDMEGFVEGQCDGKCIILWEDTTKYTIYHINQWFEKVLNGDIECWECACLNKKFIIKEYVKLLMKTDPLQLRKQIDSLISELSGKIALSESVNVFDLWNVIKSCKFANQIIENHKIVNFKEANSEYLALNSEIEDSDLLERYTFDLALPYQLLRDKTDEILKQSKIKKILQNE